MYGTQTLICAAADGGDGSKFALAAAVLTATALVVLAGLMVGQMPWRVHAGAAEMASVRLFVRSTAFGLAALAMLGVIWVGLPAILLPACAVASG
jgi:hypothetical protein